MQLRGWYLYIDIWRENLFQILSSINEGLLMLAPISTIIK